MTRRFILSIFLLFAVASVSSAQLNCFGIIAGRETTVDGSVLMAHNEDDSGEQMLNIYHVPANVTPGALSYKWVEFPGESVADSFMNEFGVCISSDSCASKEDGEPGSLLYEIRTEVAKHAKSAREAMEMIGHAVEAHGYKDSGRSYLVADPREGWVVSVVKGHHWVAMRVPDDKVLLIPNYYVIDHIDLSDTENFAGSDDIVEYAVSRGWYDPGKDGEFSFRKAYGSQAMFDLPFNTVRHESVLSAITEGTVTYNVETFSTVITPAHKLSVSDLISILSIHGDGSTVNKHPENVCINRTVVSTIFQLRSSMPREVGCIMWVCPGRPCAEAYLPVYLGADKLPEGFGRFATAEEAIEKHFTDVGDFRSKYPAAFYWQQADRWKLLQEDYRGNIGEIQRRRDLLQEKLFKSQAAVEKKALKKMSKK